MCVPAQPGADREPGWLCDASQPLAIRLVDSIVWGNRATGLGADDLYQIDLATGTAVTFDADHSDVGDVVLSGATWNDLRGNLDVDPHFARLPHLTATSPLVDAGTCTGLPATDARRRSPSERRGMRHRRGRGPLARNAVPCARMERPHVTARRRRGRRWTLRVALVLIGAGLAAYLLRRPAAPPPESIPPVAETAQPPPVPERAAPLPAETEASLPPLAESDALARDLASTLSRHPVLTGWLGTEGLIHRFVAAVDNVADGVSPRPHLGFLAPREAFLVVHHDGRAFLDPRSYPRYDQVADVFASLDPEGCADTYRRLRPLVEQAYRELGRPERPFEAALRAAIARLLATPVVESEIELEPRVISYYFADPKLEARSPAEKHLLRMGPRNVRRIQEHLRLISAAMGMAEVGAQPPPAGVEPATR